MDDELSVGIGYSYFLYPLAIDGYFQIDDMSAVNDFINSHFLSKYNCLSSLINSKNSDDSYMHGDLNNGDVSCINGFINSHNLSQCNETSSFNDMHGGC